MTRLFSLLIVLLLTVTTTYSQKSWDKISVYTLGSVLNTNDSKLQMYDSNVYCYKHGIHANYLTYDVRNILFEVNRSGVIVSITFVLHNVDCFIGSRQATRYADALQENLKRSKTEDTGRNLRTNIAYRHFMWAVDTKHSISLIMEETRPYSKELRASIIIKKENIN